MPALRQCPAYDSHDAHMWDIVIHGAKIYQDKSYYYICDGIKNPELYPYQDGLWREDELWKLVEDGKMLLPHFIKAMGIQVSSDTILPRFGANKMKKGQTEAKQVNKRAEVLQTAEGLINGDRADLYGPPEVSFGRIADLWNAMGMLIFVEEGSPTAEPKYRQLNSVDVALALTQLKVSRIIGGTDHEDSWVDAAGYIGLGAEMALREKE